MLGDSVDSVKLARPLGHQINRNRITMHVMDSPGALWNLFCTREREGGRGGRKRRLKYNNIVTIKMQWYLLITYLLLAIDIYSKFFWKITINFIWFLETVRSDDRLFHVHQSFIEIVENFSSFISSSLISLYYKVYLHEGNFNTKDIGYNKFFIFIYERRKKRRDDNRKDL